VKKLSEWVNLDVVLFTVLGLIGVSLVVLSWLVIERSEAKDRAFCAKICAPAASIYDPSRGCFCAGTPCRRF